MKNKILIIVLLVGVLLISSGCGNSTSDEVDTTSSSASETTDSTTYKLRSYTTSNTFYLTAPNGYEYDDDMTGTLHSKAVFTKDNITLTYKFTSEELEEYIEDAQRNYERKLEDGYYQDVVWQDTKNVTVNGIDVTYAKVTYNTGTTYYSYIYSFAIIKGTIFTSHITCEIYQYGESNNFENDNDILNVAWGISFNEDE